MGDLGNGESPAKAKNAAKNLKFRFNPLKFMLRLKSRPLYIPTMARSSRGRPTNAPPGFIHPCRPIVAQRPPSGPGWVHELKHDGYRLQIHVRDGRVRLYTMNGNDWTKRYPRIVEEAARLRAPLIIEAEVVHLSAEGVADFDALHSRTAKMWIKIKNPMAPAATRVFEG